MIKRFIIILFVLSLFCIQASAQQYSYYLPIIFKNPQPSTPVVIQTSEDRQQTGLTYWPDGTMGYIASDKFYAANGGTPVLTIGTLDNPAKTKQTVTIHTWQSFDYMAGGPVIEYNGVIIMVYHAEQWLDGHTVFRSSLGTAASLDGVNFYDTGLAVTAPYTGTVEMGGGSIVENGDYFYLYYRDRMPNGAVNNLGVARLEKYKIFACCHEWKKYYQGEFSQLGIGGLSSSLEAGNSLNRWFDIDQIGNEYVMVTTDASSLYIVKSTNGINWGERVEIAHSDNELFYPSLIYDGRFLVYYTDSVLGGFSRWTDARLMRLEVMGW